MMNTAVAPLERRLYQFDQFRVDPVRRLLLRDGEVVPITPKALSILLVLLEQPGKVMEKNELIQRVWPDTFVTEANLTQNVSSLRKALGERANDRRYVVTVPSQGYAFVAEVREVPVEEAAPAREAERLADERPVRVSPPTAEMGVVPPVPLRPSPALPLRRSWIALAGLALLVAVAAGWLLLQRPARPAPPQREEPAWASAPHRPSYAVLGLRNLSVNQESAWLGPALAEMLITELGAGSRVRMISGESVARARQSAGLPYLAALEGVSLGRMHTLLGADFVVVGTYISMSSGAERRLRLDLRVLKLPRGESVASVVQTGTEAELFDLVSRTGAELRRELGIGGLSPQQIREAGVLHPASPEAARLYTEGLARLRAFDSPGARQLLLEAAQADPRSAAIRSTLSRLWSDLGYDARAVEEARKAVELSGSLSREERLGIQARLHEANQEWSEASEIYRSLWTFFPDDIDYGLRLVSSLSRAGRGGEAMAALQSLRKLPAPVSEDPRIDLFEALVAKRLSDVAAEERAAAAAIAKGRRSGQSLIVAEALLVQGSARIVKGEPEAAVGLFQEAKGLYEKAGNPWGVAKGLEHLGMAWQRLGDLDGAEKVYLEALAIAQQLGNVSGVATQLGNLGRLYQDRGDLKRALDYLERARAEFGEIEEPLLEARVLNASAAILISQGELTKAAQRYEEVIAISRKIGSAFDEARALNELGTVLAWKGNLGEAYRYQEKALQVLRGQKNPSLSASILASSTDLLARLGDLATARQRNRQALTLRWQAGDRMTSGLVLGWAARFAYRTGDLWLARRLAEEQLRLARETGGRAVEAWALQELGRLALAEGDLDAARRWVEQSRSVSGSSGDDMRSMAVRLQLSRLALAERKAGEAERLAREAAAWYASREISKGEALSLAVVAEALLLQGRPAEAQRAAARIRELAKGEDRELRVLVAPAVARTEAAGGGAEALPDLEREIAEAARIGLVMAGLEARLALGEILLQQGNRKRGGEVLRGVRREAEAHKLGLFAKRAVEISRSPGALAR